MAYAALTNSAPELDSTLDSEPPPKASLPALGKPVRKQIIRTLDVLTVFVSFTCLTPALASVKSENIAWRLSVGTNQLIVIGFLLSVMNLCLASAVPKLFLLLEARFGPSTIQNYDGIIRNSVFASQLSAAWRLVLILVLVLPIGLSVAYKRFTGGESAMAISAAAYNGNATYYGMFAPPGIQCLSRKAGITLFFNATLAFAMATTPSNNSIPEAPLLIDVEPYGFSVLLLNNERAAILDTPQPSFMNKLQSLLAEGESWKLTAPVLATVAIYNNSKESNATKWEDAFDKAFSDAQASSGAFAQLSIMMIGYLIQLLRHPSPGISHNNILVLPPELFLSFNSNRRCLNHSP